MLSPPPPPPPPPLSYSANLHLSLSILTSIGGSDPLFVVSNVNSFLSPAMSQLMGKVTPPVPSPLLMTTVKSCATAKLVHHNLLSVGVKYRIVIRHQTLISSARPQQPHPPPAEGMLHHAPLLAKNEFVLFVSMCFLRVTYPTLKWSRDSHNVFFLILRQLSVPW